MDQHHRCWHLKLQEAMKQSQWKQSKCDRSSDWTITQKPKVRIRSMTSFKVYKMIEGGLERITILVQNLIEPFNSSKQTPFFSFLFLQQQLPQSLYQILFKEETPSSFPVIILLSLWPFTSLTAPLKTSITIRGFNGLSKIIHDTFQ